MEIKYPDFKNSIVNLASSIKKHFNKDLVLDYPSIKLVDDLILDKNKVVVVLLDGCGINIINGNLDDDAFLKRRMVGEMTSIFPPTTVAATNSFLKGCLPGEHGWFGWEQYFPEYDKHITMFKNEGYYTGEKLDPSLISKYVNYHDFGWDLGVKYNSIFPDFVPGGAKDFSEEINRVIDVINKDEKSFTYVYWTNPDGLIHEHGCFNPVIKANLINLSSDLERLEANLNDDTIVLVIADHGLVDVSGIDLAYYKNVNKFFRVLPSLEGRATVFYVNDLDGFRCEFNKEFGKWFNLLTTEEFLKLDLVGKKNDKVLPFLGDYIALAKDKYYFYHSNGRVEDIFLMKGHHAGITKDEMMIPLIVLKRR